ncbi:MAG: SMP-30/gluconolactonase/LRE family protein, partial [Maribacter sp.]
LQDRFSIEILDEEALQIISPTTEIKIISSGHAWTEGPLWIEDGSYLLFSDIPNNTVYKIDSVGKTTVFLDPSGYTGEIPLDGEMGANGLLLNQDGDLVLLQHGDRRIAKMNATLDSPYPNYITLVDSYDGKKLNSPNDGVLDRDGNLYFTDPPYGLQDGVNDLAKELDFQGVFCLKTSGELVLIDKLTRPNGITFSPDGSQMYVAVSDPEHAVWYRYDVVGSGKLSNRVLFFDVTDLVGKKGQQGLPDGMKMHSQGYLFATGPGGVWVINENAIPIARIFTGEATSNCAFSKNEKTLFMTADDFVLKMELK